MFDITVWYGQPAMIEKLCHCHLPILLVHFLAVIGGLDSVMIFCFEVVQYMRDSSSRTGRGHSHQGLWSSSCQASLALQNFQTQSNSIG